VLWGGKDCSLCGPVPTRSQTVDNSVDNLGVSHNTTRAVDSVDKLTHFSTPFPPASPGPHLAASIIFPYPLGMSSTSPQLYDYDYIKLSTSLGTLFRVEILTSMRATSLPEHLCVS